jgi:purine-binding chemotaxis protein CheW
MELKRRSCTFLLDGRLFGIDVERVQEVLRPPGMTRVPLAPPEVAGLINLRGLVVVAVDLRACLGLPPRPAGREPVDLVVRMPDGPVSLLVDEVADVLEIEPSAFEEIPETVTGRAREILRGTYKLKDRLLLVLDVERTLAAVGRVDAAPPTSDERDS